MKRLLLALCALMPVAAHAGETPLVLEPEFSIAPSVAEKRWFVDAFSVGLIPTSANDPVPLDIDGDFSAGGGAMIGYRFPNDILALRFGGQMVRADGVWIEDIHADLVAYLPPGADPSVLFQDWVKIPDFSRAQYYLFLGGGAQHTIGGWDSLIRAGLGVEMPITENVDWASYYLEAAVNIIGIGTRDQVLDPYPTVRTGIRITF